MELWRKKKGRERIQMGDFFFDYWNDWNDPRDGMRDLRSRFKSWKHKTKKRKQWEARK